MTEIITKAVLDVDALAQEIRRVDGGNALGAGALAEALVPFLSTLSSTDGKVPQEALAEKAERVLLDYKRGSLTNLGVVNMLRRAGFKFDYAFSKGKSLPFVDPLHAPKVPQEAEPVAFDDRSFSAFAVAHPQSGRDVLEAWHQRSLDPIPSATSVLCARFDDGAAEWVVQFLDPGMFGPAWTHWRLIDAPIRAALSPAASQGGE